MKAADPIHVALIGGKPVRFYPSQLGGTDDPPWVALSDLHQAMGLPDEDLAVWTAQLAHGDDSSTVLAGDAPLLTVSHMVASSLTARLVSLRKAPLALVQQYSVGFAEAADALLAELPPLEARTRKHKWLFESFDFGNAPRPPAGGKLS